MAYDVFLMPKAKQDIDGCVAYLTDYSPDFADKEYYKIASYMFEKLPQSPTLWSYFHITGAPFRASLYKIGKRTSYWIVYTINEQEQRIDILRVWNSTQDPLEFKI